MSARKDKRPVVTMPIDEFEYYRAVRLWFAKATYCYTPERACWYTASEMERKTAVEWQRKA